MAKTKKIQKALFAPFTLALRNDKPKYKKTFVSWCLCGKNVMLILCITLIVTACKTIAGFDQYAYTQSTSLKVDVLALMDKSTDSYTIHARESEKVISDLLKMREYERHRPNDIITYKMWDKMIDSTGQKGIVGSYFANWKADDKEGKVFIFEAKKIVSQGFDFISELESKKIKPDNPGVQNYIKSK